MKSLTSLFLLLAFVIQSHQVALSQTHVNRDWVEKIGEPLNLEWSTSINGVDNKIIHVGNTIVSGQGANVSTTVYHKDGTLDWQSDYNTSGQSNDYGIAVTFDQNENVYVLGTTDNETTTKYDLLLLKYSPSGALIWSQTFNSNYNLKDIGTDLLIDDSEQYIYICASSESATDNYDFLTLKYSINGIFQWSERYDYNNFVEIPIGIDFDDNGDVFVTGASGSTINRWDYSIVKYTIGGSYLGDERSAVPGIGFDQVLAFARDSLNNIYILLEDHLLMESITI